MDVPWYGDDAPEIVESEEHHTDAEILEMFGGLDDSPLSDEEMESLYEADYRLSTREP